MISPPIPNLIVLRSPDIDRSARFYAALGLVLTKHRHGNGPEHFAADAGGFVFEIYPLKSEPPTSGVRIGFAVDDVDLLVARLTAAGGVVVTPPQESEWGRRAIVKDPDGHTVELVSVRNSEEQRP